MAENGVVRLPSTASLDPEAQEFRPAYRAHLPLAFVYPNPPEMIYPPFPPPAYVSPPPPPPPTLPPPAYAPTRAVILSAVPPEVSESVVRRELEVFGDVRAVQMERVREGIVTVHFYDLRAAHAAFNAVRDQHMQHQNRLRFHYSYCSTLFPPNLPPPPPPVQAPGILAGHAVWAQFTIPATNAFPDGCNQGTLVVFNLDPAVSPSSTLKDIFQFFGAVKEVRETPMKRQQKFVEFYDVRDAARALSEMNGKDVNGRSLIIEFSRPGGNCNRKLPFNSTNNNNFNNHHHHPNLDCNKYPISIKPLTPSPPPRAARQRNLNRRSPPSSEGSVGTAISRLRIDEQDKSEEEKQKRKSGKASWKGGRQKKNFDPRFMIKEESILIIEGKKDSRTTLMIKNIPNKYSQKLVLNMLDNHCIHCNEQIQTHAGDHSSYDFLYLPIDFNNKCNVGYGFVNMTSPEAALRLHKAFHHQHWEVFNSRKICEVTYARVQGLEALKEHFKNSKFACENDEYLPVVFSPSRDGRRLTAPLPIVFSTSLTVRSPDHDEIDGGGFSSTSTSPTTVPSSLDCFDHHDDHDMNSTDGVDHINCCFNMHPTAAEEAAINVSNSNNKV